jgi:hypothetical protein
MRAKHKRKSPIRTQFIVDIVTNANKLLVLVQTEQEHDSDIQQIFVRDQRWIWCFSLRRFPQEAGRGGIAQTNPE